MKTSFYTVVSALFFVASGFMLATGTSWKVDDKKYNVAFTAEEADGVIKGLKSTIVFDENNLEESSFKASLDVNTINTGNGMKNKHAKAEKWLNAEKYPTINFASSQITKSDKGYIAKGKLTVKGITKEINLPFTFTKKGKTGIFKGSFSIKRQDYNITEDGIGDNIKITIDVPVKQ